MDKEEPRQLKLVNRSDDPEKEEGSGKKVKKEKAEKANKWVIVIVLLITVIVSLVFYLSSGAAKNTSVQDSGGQSNPLVQPKVYNF